MQTDNNGKQVEVEPVLIDASLFYDFVMSNTSYFEVENHSMQYCVEEILTRGKAEITRQIKTAKKTRENKVYGDLARQFNMSLAEAKAALAAAAEQGRITKI